MGLTLSGFDHQKTYTHPFFVIFIAFYYVKSGFDPKFVTLSSLVLELPILSNFGEVLKGQVNQKEEKRATMKTTTMRMENERIFKGYFGKFPIFLLP